MVTARVAVHSALFLISTLVNVALLFILLRAEFVAGVQILVYVGGVMVLFLFVIMLVQTRAEEEARVKLYTGQTWPAVIIALLLAVSFLFRYEPGAGGVPTVCGRCRCKQSNRQRRPKHVAARVMSRQILSRSARRFIEKPHCLSRSHHCCCS